jgi:hypothetical protein
MTIMIIDENTTKEDIDRYYYDLENLCFIKRAEGNEVLYWSIKKTGNFTYDYYIGQGMANEALEYIYDKKEPELLRCILTDIIKSGEVDGVVVGFLYEIVGKFAELMGLPRPV